MRLTHQSFETLNIYYTSTGTISPSSFIEFAKKITLDIDLIIEKKLTRTEDLNILTYLNEKFVYEINADPDMANRTVEKLERLGFYGCQNLIVAFLETIEGICGDLETNQIQIFYNSLKKEAQKLTRIAFELQEFFSDFVS